MTTDTAPTAASLLQLNDDVLALIVRQLNVYQQYEIGRLNRRLESIVQMLWRTRVRSVVLQDEMFRRSVTSSRHFLSFILSLAPHMERLSCHQLDVRRLRVLSSHTLEGVQSLEWLGDGNRRGRVRFVDEDVRLLRRVFPHLRRLKLRGCQITGKYLCDLEHLSELCLDDCQFLESQHFRDLFRQLRLRKFDIMEDCDEVNCCDLADLQLCPTLEHIKIADYHLCMESDITQQLLRLPRLQKLSIYSKNFVFDVLSRIARPSSPPGSARLIEAFRFSGVLHDYARFFRELGNLRQLTRLELHGQVEEEEGGQLQCLEDQALRQLAHQLRELTELHLCGYQLESPLGLLEFVINCRQLRVLDVTRSRCHGESFVRSCIAILAKQRWRSQPLELWIRHSDISPEIVHTPRCLDNIKLIKIDSKQIGPNMDYSAGVLKFSFAR
ncbi:uncharacterized protein LOC128263247 [Drosophila gunungcola]|uniref:F-box domain-containing protein n=1 Tax=Drosophila gunungcola TaxID=103775 RepID=A0A9Q0BRS9_9MUSC|nr:uncharacterized protein LOC128263247 [Drosophila gunungcola]KAI8042362.1 hypothetical protein M5D96_003674 [Drosophila gunungcola]